jgi:hypothetical protein
VHYTSPPFTAFVGVTGAVPLTARKLLFGWQHGSPSILNTAVVGVVSTIVEYLVRARTPQAVTGLQHLLTNGYCCVPDPMVNTTGAFIVVAAGIA